MVCGNHYHPASDYNQDIFLCCHGGYAEVYVPFSVVGSGVVVV